MRKVACGMRSAPEAPASILYAPSILRAPKSQETSLRSYREFLVWDSIQCVIGRPFGKQSEKSRSEVLYIGTPSS